MTLLEVKDLAITTRGGVPLLKGVDLAVGAGEILCLLGPSGAGKSLTLQAVAGLLPPALISSGRISLDGKNLDRLSPRQRRKTMGREIGYVLQEPARSLNPAIPIGEQVAEGLRVQAGYTRALARQEALAALAREGLEPAAQLARLYPHQLSGGMQQRVLLAAVLVLGPRVLLLDEPVAALDPVRTADFVSRIRETATREGMALIWVTHSLHLARELADRVAIMDGGVVVERGLSPAMFSASEHEFSRWFLGQEESAQEGA